VLLIGRGIYWLVRWKKEGGTRITNLKTSSAKPLRTSANLKTSKLKSSCTLHREAESSPASPFFWISPERRRAPQTHRRPEATPEDSDAIARCGGLDLAFTFRVAQR
jgi:hypothetical protein